MTPNLQRANHLASWKLLFYCLHLLSPPTLCIPPSHSLSADDLTSYFIKERESIRGKYFRFSTSKSLTLLPSAAALCVPSVPRDGPARSQQPCPLSRRHDSPSYWVILVSMVPPIFKTWPTPLPSFSAITLCNHTASYTLATVPSLLLLP